MLLSTRLSTCPDAHIKARKPGLLPRPSVSLAQALTTPQCGDAADRESGKRVLSQDIRDIKLSEEAQDLRAHFCACS